MQPILEFEIVFPQSISAQFVLIYAASHQICAVLVNLTTSHWILTWLIQL